MSAFLTLAGTIIFINIVVMLGSLIYTVRQGKNEPGTVSCKTSPILQRSDLGYSFQPHVMLYHAIVKLSQHGPAALPDEENPGFMQITFGGSNNQGLAAVGA